MNQISYFKVRKAIEQWLMDNKTMFKNNNILVEEVEKYNAKVTEYNV